MSILNKIFENHEILERHDGKISNKGRFSGIEKNEYWLVKDKKTEEFKLIEEIHSKNKTIKYGLYQTLYPDKFIELLGGKIIKPAILPISDLIFFAKNGMNSDATFQYLLDKLNH